MNNIKKETIKVWLIVGLVILAITSIFLFNWRNTNQVVKAYDLEQVESVKVEPVTLANSEGVPVTISAYESALIHELCLNAYAMDQEEQIQLYYTYGLSAQQWAICERLGLAP